MKPHNSPRKKYVIPRKHSACRNCGEWRPLFCRRLCQHCYRKPEVLAKFPPGPPGRMRIRCLHCKRKSPLAASGLCEGCSLEPSIREAYLSADQTPADGSVPMLPRVKMYLDHTRSARCRHEIPEDECAACEREERAKMAAWEKKSELERILEIVEMSA